MMIDMRMCCEMYEEKRRLVMCMRRTANEILYCLVGKEMGIRDKLEGLIEVIALIA